VPQIMRMPAPRYSEAMSGLARSSKPRAHLAPP
jgi:phage N-6-adenine-methyltransferase